MEKVNDNRLTEYQTTTILSAVDKAAGVRKYALNPQAQPHIDSIPAKGQLIEGMYPALKVTPCCLEDGAVVFDYIDGRPLDEILTSVFPDFDDFVDRVNEALNRYLVPDDKFLCEYKTSDGFKSIFGDMDLTGMKCICPCNLDVIFDNILIADDGTYLVDYEWVYDFAIPLDYVKYRIISHLYDKYWDELHKIVDYFHFTTLFGIKREDYPIFEKMENAYIRSIYPEEPLPENTEEKIVEQKVSLLRRTYRKVRDGYRLQQHINTIENNKRLLEKTLTKGNGFEDKFGLILSAKELNEQRNYSFEYNPLISIITPLFNTDRDALEELIISVKAQTYDNYELILCDFSDDNKLSEIVNKTAADNDRILYFYEGFNRGISENTNTCISRSKGEYIAILDHDDILNSNALYEVVKAINDGADFVYSDEAKFEGTIENIKVPYYKPDFTAEELRVHNYICHLNVYKKTLFDRCQGYKDIYDGSQDHDMVLRLTEVAEKIVHIRKCLYFWRISGASVALNIEAKPYAAFAGARAVNAQLKRMKDHGRVWCEEGMISRYTLVPHIDIKDKYRTVEFENIDFLFNRDELADKLRETDRDYVLLKHKYLEVNEEKMVARLMSYVLHNNCLAAETKLIRQDQKIYCGGAIIGLNGLSLRAMGFGYRAGGYEDMLLHDRTVVAALGLCTLIKKAEFLELLDQIEQKDINLVTAATLSATKQGREIILDVHEEARENVPFLEKIGSKIISGDYSTFAPECDPWYQTKIEEYKLETL